MAFSGRDQLQLPGPGCLRPLLRQRRVFLRVGRGGQAALRGLPAGSVVTVVRAITLDRQHGNSYTFKASAKKFHRQTWKPNLK